MTAKSKILLVRSITSVIRAEPLYFEVETASALARSLFHKKA